MEYYKDSLSTYIKKISCFLCFRYAFLSQKTKGETTVINQLQGRVNTSYVRNNTSQNRTSVNFARGENLTRVVQKAIQGGARVVQRRVRIAQNGHKITQITVKITQRLSAKPASLGWVNRAYEGVPIT